MNLISMNLYDKLEDVANNTMKEKKYNVLFSYKDVLTRSVFSDSLVKCISGK